MGAVSPCCSNAKDDDDLLFGGPPPLMEVMDAHHSPAPMKVLYVDRSSDRASDVGSTIAPSSNGQGSTLAKARTLALVQARGASAITVYAKSLDKAKVQKFREFLQAAGVDTKPWGTGGTKTLEHLFWETFSQRACIISIKDGKLKRVARILKVSLVADIFGVEHLLQTRLQFMHDGQCVERKQVVVKRLIWNEDMTIKPNQPVPFDKMFEAEEGPASETWKLGVKQVLKARLGLSESFQDQHLEEELHSHSYHVEDGEMSGSYPGLMTMYCIHQVTIRVVNTEVAAANCLGLPTGQEFATTEGDFNTSMQIQSDQDGMPLGSQLNIWTWVRRATPSSPTSPKSPVSPKVVATPSAAQIVIKRVPIPNESVRLMAKMRSVLSTSKVFTAPCRVLNIAQACRKTDWIRARQIAKRIADPNYSLREFTEDLQCFPELDLYLLDSEDLAKSGVEVSGSGRTLGDEFQRTIGCFYAIYWMMRLRSDGKDGFSFGVDENWKPIPFSVAQKKNTEQKRIKFYEESSWVNFENLLIEAEVLVKKGNNNVQVNEERVLALLALTSFHDIMKVQSLCPTVQPEHAPYHGYKSGDTITDHDHALSYLMDHYPRLLPSFNGLNENERLSVAFTQCQLQFNQGWFVQAEAPPGAIFTQFKELLVRDHKSKIMPRDIALYFVHWLTDLAGAEPTPLGGCEKFVVKFPLPVLNSFLRSFSFVHQLAHKTETEVMEEYLKMRWEEHSPSLGPLPKGCDCLAKMRLICMAQMNAARILEGYDGLQADDRNLLSTEMARTGCIGQSFSSDLTPPDMQGSPRGPSLLIYYGPAFLQGLGNDCPITRLQVLAEVYRGARELWPLMVEQVGVTVTIRIDTIKGLSLQEIIEVMRQGKVWVLVRHNDLEAFVEMSSMNKLNTYIANRQSLHVLALGDLLGDV